MMNGPRGTDGWVVGSRRTAVNRPGAVERRVTNSTRVFNVPVPMRNSAPFLDFDFHRAQIGMIRAEVGLRENSAASHPFVRSRWRKVRAVPRREVQRAFEGRMGERRLEKPADLLSNGR